MKPTLPTSLQRRFNYLPPIRDDANVSGKVASSSVWSGLGVGSTTLLRLVRSMVFARLLNPEDFGVMGLAVVFTQFILVFANFGIASSLVYHTKLTKKDLSTCWWGNCFIDLLVAIACVVFAWISVEAGEAKTVANVVSLLAIQFVVVSFGSVNMALMRREFKFKEIAITKFVGALATFIGSWFCVATLGWGVYGLCAGMIFSSIVMVLMNFSYMHWIPSFSFCSKSLRKHLSYGRWFLGVNLVSYGNANFDRLTINNLLDKTQLGFYEYAGTIPTTISIQLSYVINSVLFSAFSSLQDKPEELRRLLLKVFRYNSIVIFPLLTGIALVAPEFVLVAYGPKWMPILVPLQIFCLYGVLQLFSNPLQVLCNGIGKPKLPFKWSLIFLPINMVLVYFGVKWGGTTGAVAVKLGYPIFMAMTLGTQIMGHIELSWSRILAATWPAVSSCLAMVAAVEAIQYLSGGQYGSPLIRLVSYSVAGAVAYFACLGLFHRSDLNRMTELARKFVGREL